MLLPDIPCEFLCTEAEEKVFLHDTLAEESARIATDPPRCRMIDFDPTQRSID